MQKMANLILFEKSIFQVFNHISGHIGLTFFAAIGTDDAVLFFYSDFRYLLSIFLEKHFLTRHPH